MSAGIIGREDNKSDQSFDKMLNSGEGMVNVNGPHGFNNLTLFNQKNDNNTPLKILSLNDKLSNNEDYGHDKLSQRNQPGFALSISSTVDFSNSIHRNILSVSQI